MKVKSGNVFKINTYPNPTDNQIVIDYFNPSSDKVNMELLDVNGKKIETIFQGVVAEGNQKVLFEMPDVAEGMYFID